MNWVAAHSIDRKGIALATPQNSRCPGGPDNALMTRGSLCLDLSLDEARPSGDLLLLERTTKDPEGWPLLLRVKRNRGRGITLTLCQPGCELEHRIIADTSLSNESDAARLIYSWDSLLRWGRLALMTGSGGNIATVDISSPPPLRAQDAKTLLSLLPATAEVCGLRAVSLNSDIMPLTPLAGLIPETKIATPDGATSLGQLRRGDLVLTPEGDAVPVLHRIDRRVPAIGHDAPMRLRAPFFGLTEDLLLAPQQRLVISGTDVDYLFGRPDVRLTAEMLQGTAVAAPTTVALHGRPDRPCPLIELTQLILPRHQRFIAAGTAVESLYLGRLRRKRSAYEVSALSHLDRNTLPEHAMDPAPLLRSFDAAVLAERRIA
ncbi:Hint domain-containing protein [Phaeobacter sp. BS52]|uniref:Hint domain protein n=1 Tax=Phaeobacter piscinae TaxID=1580596 RepID=A0AAN1GUS5_9RHOB|nr:Hint domain-containing protein [Phaeobacter piscinae]ATG45354.1 Hint domain protein [Phaeobacter piscinae]AUR37667.1 Hint domain protein [Phaeobacter piscinae]